MAWSHDNSSGGERRENLIYALALPGLTNFLVFLVAAPPKPALSATPLRSCCGGGTSADAPASSVIAARTCMLQTSLASYLSTAGRLSWLLCRLALVCHYTSHCRLEEKRRRSVLHTIFLHKTIIHEESAKTSARTLSTIAVRCHASRFTRNAGASPGATHDTCVTLQEAPRGSIR